MRKSVNTTNIADTRYLLSQTPPNYVKDNYYLHELQHKVDADWKYRPNRADIEQETGIGSEEYFPLQVVMQSVQTDKGTKVSDDWRRLVFKDIHYNVRLGTRYRFAINCDPALPVEQKSIWIGVNQDSVSPTAQQVVARCNGTLGSIYVAEDGGKSYHYEPVVQTTELKQSTTAFNDVAVDPRGQLIIIAQHNKYTKDYYINQRFVIGYDRVYKVSNIIKTGALATYDPYDVGVMQIYLEMDQISDYDDFEMRIAYNGRIDETVTPEPEPPVDNYQIRVAEPAPLPAELGYDGIEFASYVYNGEEQTDTPVEVSLKLGDEEVSEYVEFEKIDGNRFKLTKTYRYVLEKLTVRVYVGAGESPVGQELSYEFQLDLSGGW